MRLKYGSVLISIFAQRELTQPLKHKRTYIGPNKYSGTPLWLDERNIFPACDPDGSTEEHVNRGSEEQGANQKEGALNSERSPAFIVVMRSNASCVTANLT